MSKHFMCKNTSGEIQMYITDHSIYVHIYNVSINVYICKFIFN